MKRQTFHHQRPAAARRIALHAQEDHILDPYQSQQKLSEPTVCPQCGAVYHNGRWQWAPRPEQGREAFCNHPAKAVMGGDQAAAAGVWQCFQCQGSSSCSWDTG